MRAIHFRRYPQGKEVPPYEEYFAYAGIRVERRVSPEGPWLGADPNTTYVLEPVDNMSDSQLMIYRSWLRLKS